jgi:hypothetical protein
VAYDPAQAYPPQPGVPGGAGAPVPAINPTWLAGSADRERAVGVLRAAFTEGRLSQDELDDRVAQAYAARTYGQLWALTADLPAGPLPYPQYLPTGSHPQAAVVPSSATEADHWRSAATLVITALVIFTLAALITALITVHTQTVVVSPFQHVNLAPYITYQQGP